MKNYKFYVRTNGGKVPFRTKREATAYCEGLIKLGYLEAVVGKY